MSQKFKKNAFIPENFKKLFKKKIERANRVYFVYYKVCGLQM